MIQGQIVDGRFECRGTTVRPEPGESWIAWDRDHEVVLRLVSGMVGADQERAAFMKAAMAAMKLGGPSVEKIIHAGFVGDNRPYVVTEKISGRSLAEELAAGQPMDVQRALGIAVPIAEALAEAARRACSHGHLSPSVVMLPVGSRKGRRKTADGRVKVVGFAPWEAVPTQTVFDRDSTAPEVIGGTPPDIRSDCWSLGVILYRMLTGIAPATAESHRKKGGSHSGGRVQPPSSIRPDAGISPELDIMVMRLLEKDPEKRLSAPEQLVTHMKSLMDGGAGTAVDSDASRPEPDTAENDFDEGISFASGKRVRTTRFAAADVVAQPPADGTSALYPTDTRAVPPTPHVVLGPDHIDPVAATAGKPVRGKSQKSDDKPRSGGVPVIAVVFLIGFFVLAAIVLTGWFVLQYQSRQIELAKVPAVSAPATLPARVAPISTAPVAPVSTAPAAAVSTAPAAPVVTAPVVTAPVVTAPAPAPAPLPPIVATQATTAPAPKPATQTTTASKPAVSTSPAVTATKPAVKTAATTISATKPTAPTSKKASTSGTSRKLNWDDGLNEGEIDKAPAAKPAGSTDTTKKPALDWGD